MAREPGKHRFRRSPTNYFLTETKFWSRTFLKKIWLFRTSTAPERSEKGLGRSGTIREHSEMTWNAWNWLKMTKYHPKIIRKQPKNIHRWPSGCHFSDFLNFLEGRLPPEDGSDQAENLTRSVSDEIAKNIFLARKRNPGVTFRIFPIFRIPRAHGSGALGGQPVWSTAILVDNNKNQIASRFDFFCWYVFKFASRSLTLINERSTWWTYVATALSNQRTSRRRYLMNVRRDGVI